MGSEKVPLQAPEEPGKVIELQKEGPVVGTGNQQGLLLTSVQPGKKKMSGEDFLRGANIEIGQKLGLINEEK